MSARPRLSLCIPTWNRGRYLQGALESGLREAAGQPPGTVEVLVCDNASTDETAEVISRIQAAHPELCAYRNPENIGFDRNYLRCVEEARGEFVWIMGDDDEWLPGSLARVLRELDAGADACLCLAEACDLDLRPITVLQWYLGSDPPQIWQLNNREDLIRYFNSCAYSAGAFGFISVSIFSRDRFLQNRESLKRADQTGYVHVWGMLEYLRQPLFLHYVPEALVRNRLSDSHADSMATTDLYGRWMNDLRTWAWFADMLLSDDPEMHDSFSRIIGRNHHNTIVPGLRRCAPTEAAWQDAKPYLVRAGFSSLRIASVDFAHQWLRDDRHPLPTLNPAALCLVDLPILSRGAERIAIIALSLQSLLDGASLLTAFRKGGRTRHLRVFCPQECAELLDGFELQCLDPKRYAKDLSYRESIAQTIIDFIPELLINLDRNRGIEADDLVAATHPAGAIAFELPVLGQSPELIKAANDAYTCLLPRAGGLDSMLAALGLENHPPALWPSSNTLAKAQAMLNDLGWDPAKTLVFLVDHPSLLENPDLQQALVEAMDDEWTVVGLGTRITHPLLAALLDSYGGRALNLAGGLGLGPMAALLGLGRGYVGGTPLLQSMARACGCPPFPSKATR